MKKILPLILALLFTQILHAQNAPDFSIENIKKMNDMNAVAKKAVEYILATPADTTDKMRRDAEGFLYTWMEKTKDYSFALDYSIAKIMEENKSAAFVLFAAMAECLFKDKTQSDEEVKLYAMRRLIAYAEHPANKLYTGKELKKTIRAEKKGKLKEYLNEKK